MSDQMKRSGHDGLGIDPVVAEALRSLDPAAMDANYWLRFRGWVMTGASRELARRRLMAQLTVGDVMSQWARTLVPTAVLAAALAGMLLVRSTPVTQQATPGLEELLVTEVPVETVPVAITAPGADGAVVFASEVF